MIFDYLIYYLIFFAAEALKSKFNRLLRFVQCLNFSSDGYLLGSIVGLVESVRSYQTLSNDLLTTFYIEYYQE